MENFPMSIGPDFQGVEIPGQNSDPEHHIYTSIDVESFIEGHWIVDFELGKIDKDPHYDMLALVRYNNGDHSLYMYKGNIDGVDQSNPQILMVGGEQRISGLGNDVDLKIVNVNNDNKVDVMISDWAGSDMVLVNDSIANTGLISFAAPKELDSDPNKVYDHWQVVNTNNDGVDDFLALREVQGGNAFYDIYESNSQGGYTNTASIDSGVPSSFHAHAADFAFANNADGTYQFATSHYKFFEPSIISVYKKDLDGNITKTGEYNDDNSNSNRLLGLVEFADIDGENGLDLLVGKQATQENNGSSTIILLENGSGGYQPILEIPDANIGEHTTVNGLAYTNVDQDSAKELIVHSQSSHSTLQIFDINHDGLWSADEIERFDTPNSYTTVNIFNENQDTMKLAYAWGKTTPDIWTGEEYPVAFFRSNAIAAISETYLPIINNHAPANGGGSKALTQ